MKTQIFYGKSQSTMLIQGFIITIYDKLWNVSHSIDSII